MELFTISMVNHPANDVEKLLEHIRRNFADLHTIEGIAFDSVVGHARTDIRFTSKSPGFSYKQSAPQVFQTAAQALADYMIAEQESAIIRKIITKEYDYKTKEEIDKIEMYCSQLMDNTGEESPVPDNKSRRRTKLQTAFNRYLEYNTLLNIEGFIRFRLEHYVDELREVVEYAIDEYILDKQYQDFIALLKYFVYIQDAKIPVAHLMHKGDHEFVMLNEELRPIETKQVDSFVVEMIDKEINYEDMIVSTLITVSPQKVYIHTRQPEMQVIKTIRQIFEDRAEVCVYCASCKPILGDQGNLLTQS